MSNNARPPATDPVNAAAVIRGSVNARVPACAPEISANTPAGAARGQGLLDDRRGGCGRAGVAGMRLDDDGASGGQRRRGVGAGDGEGEREVARGEHQDRAHRDLSSAAAPGGGRARSRGRAGRRPRRSGCRSRRSWANMRSCRLVRATSPVSRAAGSPVSATAISTRAADSASSASASATRTSARSPGSSPPRAARPPRRPRARSRAAGRWCRSEGRWWSWVSSGRKGGDALAGTGQGIGRVRRRRVRGNRRGGPCGRSAARRRRSACAAPERRR